MEVNMAVRSSKVKITRYPSGMQILDAALGGGFPVGTISLIVGTPGNGWREWPHVVVPKPGGPDPIPIGGSGGIRIDK